jgi:hypothetical protein
MAGNPLGPGDPRLKVESQKWVVHSDPRSTVTRPGNNARPLCCICARSGGPRRTGVRATMGVQRCSQPVSLGDHRCRCRSANQVDRASARAQHRGYPIAHAQRARVRTRRARSGSGPMGPLLTGLACSSVARGFVVRSRLRYRLWRLAVLRRRCAPAATRSTPRCPVPQSRCRCGRGGPGPGADVAGAGTSPAAVM